MLQLQEASSFQGASPNLLPSNDVSLLAHREARHAEMERVKVEFDEEECNNADS